MDMNRLPSYLSDLNGVQREAVLHYGKPLLILAGAGSGKTRVITVKIAYLIDVLGMNPRDILAVTFTNKAAQEMRDRAAGLSSRASDVLIRTFHSFGSWLLRRNCSAAGLDSRFTIYDDDDVLSLLKTLFPDGDRRDLHRTAFCISRAKDFGLGPEEDLSDITPDPEFPAVYRSYEDRLRAIGNADFGDLILLSVKMLRNVPEVKSRIQDRFRVILVDEYQDSNTAQFELLRELAGPDAYVCVVGDDDQSIYRFRGAEVRNILTFSESFPGTEIVRLEQNYRSTGFILDAASAVVSHNKGRLGKTLWTENEQGKPPYLVSCADQDAEAAFCLSLVRKDPEAGLAILYRTNAQSRVFESLFLKESVPYLIVGTVRFYEREEVKDVVAFLKFLANPRDEVAFRRIVNKPARGMGDAKVDAVLAEAEAVKGDLVEAAGIALERMKGKARTALADFVGLCRELYRSLEKETLPAFVDRLIRDSGLEEYHRRQDEIASTQKLSNLEELVNAASLYSGGMEGLTEFLEGIELDSARIEGTAPEGGNKVTLITMHNTKGLEFDRVVATGMEEGLFPRGGEESEADIEEERRLFYVAITRARKEVYFTHCGMRRLHGKLLPMQPSRFLRELPEDVQRTGKQQNGNDGFEIGGAVYHEEYGQGMVVRRWYEKDVFTIQVRFDSGKVMRFLPKYERRLERIETDGI